MLATSTAQEDRPAGHEPRQGRPGGGHNWTICAQALNLHPCTEARIFGRRASLSDIRLTLCDRPCSMTERTLPPARSCFIADAAQIWRYSMARLLRVKREATERGCVGTDPVLFVPVPVQLPAAGWVRADVTTGQQPSVNACPAVGCRGHRRVLRRREGSLRDDRYPYQTARP